MTEDTAQRLRNAGQLRTDWELRAQSSARDFFIASHPGWDVPERWEQQAGVDARFALDGLDAAALAGHDVLEIGCGVGRLAPHLAPRVLSYTGCDIAESMVSEAQRRHRRLGNARFLLSDGLGTPPQARDRLYQLALAWAVFIHCPRDVIAALVTDCWSLLAPGGELRFQLRADVAEAMAAGGADAASVADAREQQAAADIAVPPESLALVDGSDYMGATFRADEVEDFLQRLTGGKVTTVRADPLHIYGTLRRSRRR